MYDFHVHTKFSYDANEQPEDYIKEAIKKGFKEICFTDHADLMHPWPLKRLYPYMEEYKKEVLSLKEKYTDIKIRFGLEVGLNKENIKRTYELTKSEDFDFIIASQHTALGNDPGFDKTLYERHSEKEYMRIYLTETKNGLTEFDDYDAAGHIGYMARFLSSPRPLLYEEYKNEITEILEVLISKQKALEINTAGIYTTKSTMPHISIIKRYKDMGGKLLTTGSDAHFLCVLGHEFESTFDMLKECGIKEVFTYEKRKPIPHGI